MSLSIPRPSFPRSASVRPRNGLPDGQTTRVTNVHSQNKRTYTLAHTAEAKMLMANLPSAVCGAVEILRFATLSAATVQFNVEFVVVTTGPVDEERIVGETYFHSEKF